MRRAHLHLMSNTSATIDPHPNNLAPKWRLFFARSQEKPERSRMKNPASFLE